MKKSILLLFAALLPLVASAAKVEIDGIWYNLVPTARQAEVISSDGTEYSDSITIPATVTFIGMKYSVTSIGDDAFRGCSSLTSINIPENSQLTSIGDWAFYNCSSLAAINIPEGVTSIGEDAFYGCTSLTTITIPEGVTSIGTRAFEFCNSLTSITIPENSQLTSIGDGAFHVCSSLTTITIPEGVTSIGRSAFSSCRSLTAINIPAGVTSIGEGAFSGCSSLTAITVASKNSAYDSRNNCNAIIETKSNTLIAGCSSTVIPEGVTSIRDYAFYGCSSLTSITIPYIVTSIGNYAFHECSGLKSITIPEGVTSIGNGAFSYCISLTSIILPEGVTSIGDYAFDLCLSLTAITIPEGVTSIGNYAFSDCRSLYKVINYSDLDIQKGSTDNGYVAYYADVVYQGGELTTIGDFQFYTSDGIHSLVNYIGKDTGIVLPDSYNGESYNIGEWAFSGCSSLTAINIPKGVTSIEYGTFRGCSSLTAITIPESVTSIGSYAFYDCRSLTAIDIPEGVTSIGESAFSYCSSLTAINIPEGVTSIGNQAFEFCSSLTSVTIPENSQLTSIGNQAFEFCSSLTSVTIPENSQLTSIGDWAFYNCSSLAAITIPASVTSIGGYAFSGCSSLERVTINCANVSSWFSGLSSIKEIVLGESVRSIEQGAFSGYSSLESLHIGPNVDSYGSEAFAGCTAIKEITVMGNVMPEIPSENITSITLYSPIPLVTKEFAAMVYRNAMLNIPKGSLTRYQNADVWKNFWYVNEFDPKEGKEIFLTLHQADNGYVKQHLTEGTVCTFTIVAAEGWTIHSVTFNGEEVTAQLTEEGTFTTPALQADAVLNIAYEKTEDNTMVENARASRIKVQGHQGTLRITGTTQGDDISVYTTGGTLAAQESAEGDETLITLPTGQVYIVTVADKVVKIGM